MYDFCTTSRINKSIQILHRKGQILVLDESTVVNLSKLCKKYQMYEFCTSLDEMYELCTSYVRVM